MKLCRLLGKISNKYVQQETDIDVAGKCEDETLGKARISAAELQEIKTLLDGVDFDELQRKLEEAKDYLVESIKAQLEGGGLGQGESDPVLEKLKKIAEKLKRLAVPPTTLDELFTWVSDICDILFQGPLERMIKLIIFYAEWGANLGNEAKEMLVELEKTLIQIERALAALAKLLPLVAKIPIILMNISKLLAVLTKDQNSTVLQTNEMNNYIFQAREENDTIEKNEYLAEEEQRQKEEDQLMLK